MPRILNTSAAVACIFAATPVLALDQIYSPDVGYRELSLEYNGSRTFDTHSGKNNDQAHELAIEAGIAPRWAMEFSGSFEKLPDDALKMTDAEWQNRFQFFDQGKYWLDAGLLVAYDQSVESHVPSSLEAKLLLQKDLGRFTSTANVGFTQNIGKNAGGTGGPDYVFLWNTRYRYNQYVEPGIEIQSDLGQGPQLGRFNRQGHYIGPAAYGEIFPHVSYQAAWLFGVTPASAQSAARLLIEYEAHF